MNNNFCVMKYKILSQSEVLEAQIEFNIKFNVICMSHVIC